MNLFKKRYAECARHREWPMSIAFNSRQMDFCGGCYQSAFSAAYDVNLLHVLSLSNSIGRVPILEVLIDIYKPRNSTMYHRILPILYKRKIVEIKYELYRVLYTLILNNVRLGRKYRIRWRGIALRLGCRKVECAAYSYHKARGEWSMKYDRASKSRMREDTRLDNVACTERNRCARNR